MWKFLNALFVTLGVIFLVIIALGIYFYVTDPLNLKPIIFGDDAAATNANTGDNVDKHPSLNESQEAALERMGINPANIPSEITPEQEACFEEKLGTERVNEIKAGDSPNSTDYFKARDCI